jgi:hypothetical protein
MHITAQVGSVPAAVVWFECLFRNGRAVVSQNNHDQVIKQ